MEDDIDAVACSGVKGECRFSTSLCIGVALYPQDAQDADTLYRFADIWSVEGFLEELAEKAPPRVLHLPRAPGEREARERALRYLASALESTLLAP